MDTKQQGQPVKQCEKIEYRQLPPAGAISSHFAADGVGQWQRRSRYAALRIEMICLTVDPADGRIFCWRQDNSLTQIAKADYDFDYRPCDIDGTPIAWERP